MIFLSRVRKERENKGGDDAVSFMALMAWRLYFYIRIGFFTLFGDEVVVFVRLSCLD